MRELTPYVLPAIAAVALAGLLAYPSTDAEEADPVLACQALRCIAFEAAGVSACVKALDRFYAVRAANAEGTAWARARFLQSCPTPPDAGAGVINAVRRARPPGSPPLQLTTPG